MEALPLVYGERQEAAREVFQRKKKEKTIQGGSSVEEDQEGGSSAVAMEAPPSSSSSPSTSPSPAPETFHTLSLSPPPPLPPPHPASSSSSAQADSAHHRPSSYTRHASFQHSSPASPSLSRHSSFHSQDPKSRRALDRIVSSNFRHTPKVFSAGEDVWKGQFVPAEVSQRAEFVGSDHGQKSKQHRSSIFDLLRSLLQSGNRGARKLLVLIILNITYSSVELVLGLLSGRVGLVSDAFHLTFGCGLLSFSLIAMLYTKKMRDNIYTYGYKRLEVMAAFTNALFLLFLSFSLAVEALHAFIQDESEHKHYLIVSAVTNLFVNLLGVWFFRSYARIRIVYRKAEDMNHHSIFLHVLSDSIRSAGLILASWLLTLGVKNAETLCLGLVAVAVFLVVMPLFKATAGILLQMSPMGISASILHRCIRQVTTLEDVLECLQAQFWEMVPGFVVGTLRIQVKAGTDEQKVLKHVHSVYNDIGIKDLSVQIDTD